MGRLAGLFGFVWAACAGVALATPGLFVSGKGYLPVDRDASGGLTLETSRRVDVLLLRGAWEGQRRWEYLSSDAHRWAEALIHPAMVGLPARARVLLLGGEDGAALRELLTHAAVGQVEVWSHRRRRLAWLKQQPLLGRRLGWPFRDRRVTTRAFAHRGALLAALQRSTRRYHRIFVALERPWRQGRLAPQMSAFFGLLGRRLAARGLVACLWGELKPVSHYACMLRAMKRAGWQVQPYRSLGTGITWGLALASPRRLPQVDGRALPAGLRYLMAARWSALMQFPPDEDPAKASLVDCDE